MLGKSDIILALMSARKNHSLEQPFYTDQGVFDLDMAEIFYKEWLFAVPAVELPKPGDYVTYAVGAYSVIIVRGADNEIRAFHNTCRHRGAQLCPAGKGSNPKLVCPYHQWTYELDGRLLWARDMGSDFDASKHGLKSVHCRVISGLVYICLADNAPSLDEFAAEASRYLAPHDLENTKIAYESTIVENGNWKLVIENNRECYHCSGNHPSLCRTYPEDPSITGVSGAGTNATVSNHWESCEAAGLPSKFLMDNAGKWRLTRMPLIGTAESYTMSGKVAVQKPLGKITKKAAGALLKFAYPNTWNHFLSDHAIVFRITPLTPTTTAVTTKWLVHKDAVEGQDYDLPTLTKVWTDTNDEDREVVEANQLGINSPVYEPGPYSELHEGGVIQFLDWYKSTLQSRLAPLTLVAAE